MTAPLRTARLELRPTGPEHSARAAEILSDPEVGRMISAVTVPYPEAEARAWLATHAAERDEGRALRFAVFEDVRMIGCVDVAELDTGTGALGVWFERAAWGRGLAFEAASALLAEVSATVRPAAFRASHAEDNTRSPRLLARLGFARTGERTILSRARGAEMRQIDWRRPP